APSGPARRSRTSRSATTAAAPCPAPSRQDSTTSTASRSVRHADPRLGIFKIEWFKKSDAKQRVRKCIDTGECWPQPAGTPTHQTRESLDRLAKILQIRDALGLRKPIE